MNVFNCFFFIYNSFVLIEFGPFLSEQIKFGHFLFEQIKFGHFLFEQIKVNHMKTARLEIVII